MANRNHSRSRNAERHPWYVGTGCGSFIVLARNEEDALRRGERRLGRPPESAWPQDEAAPYEDPEWFDDDIMGGHGDAGGHGGDQ